MSLDKFNEMLRFGIHLKLSGPQEDKYYAQRLRFFLMELEEFDAESEDDVFIDVYFLGEKELRIKVFESSLKFEPIGDNSYDCIMAVLQFISTMHEQVQKDFKKDGFIEDEMKTPKKVSQPEKEESSWDDDDMEWI